MELNNSVMSNLALNFIGQLVQNNGVEELTNNANIMQEYENNGNQNAGGLFEKEYDASDIYGTVGQIAGYAYGGVAGGMVGKILGGVAGSIIENAKEEILGENSSYLKMEDKLNNAIGGFLSLITGNMSIEKNAGSSIFNDNFKTLLA